MVELDEVSMSIFGRREYFHVYAAVAGLPDDGFETRDVSSRCSVASSTISRALGALRAADLLEGRNGHYRRKPSCFWAFCLDFALEVAGEDGAGSAVHLLG